MAVKKSELYSSLWASCDELRGSMDASQYKDYVLVLLFMKYVSDKADRVVRIPEGASFDDMRKLKGKPNIGDQINKIIGKFAKANNLTGIITEADFNDDEKLGRGKDKVDRLSNLIEIFEDPALDFSKNRAKDDDLLGDAYEYLMRHFATESGKSKGQFYTPAEVSRVMAKVIDIENATSQSDTLYDPTCGSGSLLLKAAAEAPYDISIYGQENDNATRALAVMNMWLHDNPTSEIVLGNTLSSPEFKDEKTGLLKTFDYAVSNPPFSYKTWRNGFDPENDLYRRFDGYELPPKRNGDYAFLLHLVKSIKSTGKGCIVMPLGVLFRGNTEASIRKQLVRKGYIKGIIGLPKNLFYGTGIAACLIVLDKENARERTDIFMIDASEGYIKDGNKNRLREQDIHKIVDTFNNRIEIPKYSRIIPIEEIASDKNNYNLNIPRYIDNQEEEDIQDLVAHIKGGIPNRDIENLNKYWEVYPTMKEDIFTNGNKDGYSQLSIDKDKIKATIFNHPEFNTFSEKIHNVFSNWRDEAAAQLKEFDRDMSPKQQIEEISEDLLNSFENIKLIDKYNVYQHLMNYWEETMQDDLYEITAEGWQIGNKVKRLTKKTKKKTKDIKGIKGLEGILIPTELMIKEYFSEEQEEIDKLKTEKEKINSKINQLSEKYSEEGEALHDVTSKTSAREARDEYTILAWQEYLEDSYKKYEEKKYKHEELNEELEILFNKPHIEALQNQHGNITNKALKEQINSDDVSDVNNDFERCLKVKKEVSSTKKKMNKMLKATRKKIDELTQENTDADFIRELSIIMQYLDLRDKETDIKKEIKSVKSDLEKKIIIQYPKPNIEAIKQLVVDKKWMAEIEKRIQDELDDISQRLTGRIKELAERYEKPMPEIENKVANLEERVKNHLEEMGVE